jgi:hypothetical protein
LCQRFKGRHFKRGRNCLFKIGHCWSIVLAIKPQRKAANVWFHEKPESCFEEAATAGTKLELNTFALLYIVEYSHKQGISTKFILHCFHIKQQVFFQPPEHSSSACGESNKCRNIYCRFRMARSVPWFCLSRHMIVEFSLFVFVFFLWLLLVSPWTLLEHGRLPLCRFALDL